MIPRPSRPPSPLAAIDLGSNSFRLEIAQLQHGHYRRIAYLKETVRLGGGLDAEGRLTEPAVQRGLDCLRRFADRIDGFDPIRVRAVATQTLREATNRDEFLARAQAVLGLPIEVISGREEARLIYGGVSFLQPSVRPRLVIDIGGRSTELILGEGRAARVTESFQVGSVSLSMRWFPEGRFTADAFRAAQIAAGAELEEALDAFAPDRWEVALGSSGTVGAVSALLVANRITDGRITPQALRWCIAKCISAGSVERLALPGILADRKPVIGGGLALLYTLVTHFGIEALWPAKGALRQGLIVELHERLSGRHRPGHADLRDDTVAELQHRFDVNLSHADRVRSVALPLFHAMLPQALEDAVRELGWACEVHEIGLMVSHHDHHRHSAYLMGHVDAPGFSQNQQRRVASLVLGQRGGLRKLEDRLVETPLAWQVLALRLAVIKCHARGPTDPKALRLRRDGNQALLDFSPAWAASRPRTLHLLREEAARWAERARAGAANPLRLRLPSHAA
jgi:exopolyphosphatase/guanosine-5'-triphosphate,3'-diphosphate pyrophosphatase